MKKYCIDMSGISTPVERMPADIYGSVWDRVIPVLASGVIGVTIEIYNEMVHIPGPVGDCIRECKAQLVLEVEQGDWDWQSYLNHVVQMQRKYEEIISEFNGGRRNTVGLNDISIIALGKTLGIPVVSMEALPAQISQKRKRIPEVCNIEGVLHYDFNEFLRKEGIRF